MSSSELLTIEPLDLHSPETVVVELRKQISCSLLLTNKTDSYVAFKVKTTNPKKYCVRPNSGVVLPMSASEVTVTMQAQKEAPSDMQCKDKFLLQSVMVSPEASTKEVTQEMFTKKAGRRVEETKLRVLYVSPPRPPSPVREGSEEGSSPRASVDNGNSNGSEFTTVPRTGVERFEPQDDSSEAKVLITKLTEEKNIALHQSNKLQQELELLRRGGGDRGQSGIPFVYVLAIGLIGIILGYLKKRT